ncbi:MarR family winged helix-turn-helix transcriptional regulator [Tsukamurella ocularis]|uniref:MarR family winged helix-turn-helix transcriptional regulator n=1 Tax=Tsukamurella ocularis TaxID=1970234 RepID=UPI0039EEB7EF
MHAINSEQDGDLPNALVALLEVLHPPSGSGLLALLDEAHLTPSQLKALLAIDAEPETLTVKALAERVGLSEAAMSRCADGLVERGLVERSRHGADGRARSITATASGHGLAARMAAVRHDRIAAFAQSLAPADRRRLAEAIDAALGR